MSKKKIFNEAQDINGKKFRYPLMDSATILFHTYPHKDEDDEEIFQEAQYFIYPLFTKSNYSGAQLYEVTEESYNQIKDILSTLYSEVIEFEQKNKSIIEMITSLFRLKAIYDNLTLEETLQLSENSPEFLDF